MPLELHSNQGKNVDGALIREICDLTVSRKTRTSAYHPAGNAITDRENATIKNMLSAYYSEERDDRDEHLGPVMMAYRSMVHSTLNETPNMMMLGRQVRVPIDALLPAPPEEHHQKMPASEYAASLMEAMAAAHKVVSDHVDRWMRYQKREYDRHIDEWSFHKGQAVWLRTYPSVWGKSRALDKPWDGPYIVLYRISDVMYRIQKTAKSTLQVVHSDRLKPFYSEVADPWARAHWVPFHGSGFTSTPLEDV